MQKLTLSCGGGLLCYNFSKVLLNRKNNAIFA